LWIVSALTDGVVIGWVVLHFVRPGCDLQNKDNQGIRGGLDGSRPKPFDA